MDARVAALTDWLASFIGQQPQLQMVSGDASFRRYFRFIHQGLSYIAVDAPTATEDSRLFCALAAQYQKQGVLASTVLEANFELGFMWQQDLGNELLFSYLTPEHMQAWYQKSIAILPRIAHITHTEKAALPSYDRKLLDFELEIFKEWLLEKTLGIDLTKEQLQSWQSLKHQLIESALEQPQVGIHRDFHSRNIMVTQGHLAVIDFQGALIGPCTYDLVSLLKDCYIECPSDIRNTLVKQYYYSHKDKFVGASLDDFQRWFDLMGAQRHLKAAGIFCRLNLRDGKPGYLRDVTQTLKYLIEIADKYQLGFITDIVSKEVMSKWSAR